ncbi:MAG: shikimate dehydrogenase [bacterium]|nr:shikimate dehydrogenase [bacterium]
MTITGTTRVLAILGDPIAHARAPRLVNDALAARGDDAVMVPIQVAADGLARVVDGLRAMQSFAGGVVTMPHKEAIVALLDDVSAEARQVGACNTIRRTADGRLVGTMFDGEGFVAGLAASGHAVRGRRVFLCGAGGAAAAIAFAMGRHGATRLTLYNRTTARAAALADHVRAAWPALAVALGGPDPSGHDLVVNATALGMRPGDAALPCDVSGMTPGTLAADVVIRQPTAFLAAAAARGAVVVGGEPMLVAQIGLIVDFVLAG